MTYSFYQAVYQVTAQIPAGRVATYGQIAFLAGRPRASRIVGGAMARAPEGLPCHRVIYRRRPSQPAGCVRRARHPADASRGGGRPLPPRRPGGPVPVPVGRGHVLLPALRIDS